jgi:hypothetical protein
MIKSWLRARNYHPSTSISSLSLPITQSPPLLRCSPPHPGPHPPVRHYRRHVPSSPPSDGRRPVLRARAGAPGSTWLLRRRPVASQPCLIRRLARAQHSCLGQARGTPSPGCGAARAWVRLDFFWFSSLLTEEDSDSL